MNDSATAGPAAPVREPAPSDSLGSTLEDYRLALGIVAGGVLLSFLGFLWVLTSASAAASRRLNAEMDGMRSAARDARSTETSPTTTTLKSPGAKRWRCRRTSWSRVIAPTVRAVPLSRLPYGWWSG